VLGRAKSSDRGVSIPQRIKDKGQQHLPGEEAWLVGEYRTSGEKKYYLANLPAATDLRALAATIKARNRRISS
jgi:SRSO17 transposase